MGSKKSSKKQQKQQHIKNHPFPRLQRVTQSIQSNIYGYCYQPSKNQIKSYRNRSSTKTQNEYDPYPISKRVLRSHDQAQSIMIKTHKQQIVKETEHLYENKLVQHIPQQQKEQEEHRKKQEYSSIFKNHSIKKQPVSSTNQIIIMTQSIKLQQYLSPARKFNYVCEKCGKMYKILKNFDLHKRYKHSISQNFIEDDEFTNDYLEFETKQQNQRQNKYIKIKEENGNIKQIKNQIYSQSSQEEEKQEIKTIKQQQYFSKQQSTCQLQTSQQRQILMKNAYQSQFSYNSQLTSIETSPILDKSCFCNQRFPKYQNLYKHIINMHPRYSLTASQHQFSMKIKKKAKEEFNARIQKYSKFKIKLKGTHCTQIHKQHLQKKQKDIFNQYPRIEYDEQPSMQQVHQPKNQELVKFLQKPYICDIDKDFTRQFIKLSVNECIDLKKKNKFLAECICHLRFKYVGSMIKHIRYKHINRSNVNDFYMEYYLHRISQVNYVKVVFIKSEREKQKNMQNGCLNKLNLAHKSSSVIFEESLLNQFRDNEDFYRNYDKGDQLVNFKQMGINIKFLGLSNIEDFRQNCKKYQRQLNFQQIKHVVICFCKSIMYHGESIRRHMRKMHGYEFKKDIKYTKKSLLTDKHKNKQNKIEYFIRTFNEGRVMIHRIQEGRRFIYSKIQNHLKQQSNSIEIDVKKQAFDKKQVHRLLKVLKQTADFQQDHSFFKNDTIVLY